MHSLSRLIAAATLLLLAAESPASPAEAGRIRKSWQLAMENWALETRAATTPAARAAARAKQPDTLPYARDMWAKIGSALDQEWTLEHMAWFLRVAPGLREAQPDGSVVALFTHEVDGVFKAIESYHLKSPQLMPVCMALAGTGDPRAVHLLEKIQTTHPETRTQGVAALASALILKALGDDPELMRKRLTCLRKAIIDSSDVDLGGITVAKVAEDELYIIRFLTKGRVAPDLSGVDSAGRALRLSDFAGRIVVLLFWSSTMDEAERVIGITSEMKRKFQGRPLEVVGVNQDSLEKLRSLEAEGSVNWRSFSDPSNQLAAEYRVAGLPLAYVLDGERKIHYAGAPGSFVELTAEALLSEMASPAGE
jgi:peroxiredoxin